MFVVGAKAFGNDFLNFELGIVVAFVSLSETWKSTSSVLMLRFSSLGTEFGTPAASPGRLEVRFSSRH